MTTSPTQKDQSALRQAQSIPIIEWIVGSLGLLLLLTIITLLIHQGLTDSHAPPQIVITNHSIITHPNNHHVVKIRVTNQGGSAASQVLIAGELKDTQGNTIEQAQAQIAFLPKGSHQTAGLIFTHDPRTHQLQLRPLGFQQP